MSPDYYLVEACCDLHDTRFYWRILLFDLDIFVQMLRFLFAIRPALDDDTSVVIWQGYGLAVELSTTKVRSIGAICPSQPHQATMSE